MTQLIKIQALTADELLNEFELTEPEAEKVLVRDTAPQISIEHLIKSEYYADAIKLLAHGLPKREAVWWACLAARKAQTPDTDEDNINALLATETWARKPTEEHRQRCRELGEKTQYKTAASWAATAAYWCSGSMTDPGEPEVPPPPFLYAHAVSGCITLAAATIDPENIEHFYKLFLSQGIDLAQGGNGMIEGA
ncbi:MAG: hypothetical protein CMI02_12875 [Oceanospirillaceae bacterium]|nr:hypothetical protein [Oceanospirillaceae bacterium]MBT12914.1 hypothetical protein [Oceanospirillaceae bacterium]|tara:strand:- start:157103 stop:157687 length:585 start_codon:yes stop_codon:yes gene_type:complete